MYPNYYCKINTDNLNVKLVNEECMKKNRSLYNVLAENQYDLYKNQYNLNINADVDEDCQELHCYYNDTEIENMLNRIGIAYYPNGNKKWFDNAASFTSYNEIADGIYENSSVYIEFDENENPVYSDIKSSGKWGLSIQHCQLIKDYSWYILPSSDTQGLKRIVSIKDAYSKLCNGEG